MLVKVGGTVVVHDLRPGILLVQDCTDMGRQIPLGIGHDVEGEPSAAPQEHVVRQDHESAPCQLIGIGAPAIVGGSER